MPASVGRHTLTIAQRVYYEGLSSGPPPGFAEGTRKYCAGYRPEARKAIYYGTWAAALNRAGGGVFRAKGFAQSWEGEVQARVWLATYGGDAAAEPAVIYVQ